MKRKQLREQFGMKRDRLRYKVNSFLNAAKGTLDFHKKDEEDVKFS